MDALFSELRRIASPAKVVVIYFGKLRQERLDQGWPDKNLWHEYDIFLRGETTLKNITELTSDSESVNIFSGVLYNRAMRRVFLQTMKNRSRTILMTEGREFNGLKGLLRLMHSWWIEGKRRHDIDRIFALGELAASNYSRLGFSSSKISPFSYVVEPPPFIQPSTIASSTNRRIHFTTVGRLIPLKRIDLTISALAALPKDSWRLTIVGDGPQRSALERITKEHCLDIDNITFTGVIPNDEVKMILGKADYMIFSSNRDGWGAVVNESLMAGTPVICSRYPGASTLVHDGFNGRLFETDNLDSLINVLNDCISNGITTESDRRIIADWATCIYPTTLARYFLDLLSNKSSTQTAPWLTLPTSLQSNLR